MFMKRTALTKHFPLIGAIKSQPADPTLHNGILAIVGISERAHLAVEGWDIIRNMALPRATRDAIAKMPAAVKAWDDGHSRRLGDDKINIATIAAEAYPVLQYAGAKASITTHLDYLSEAVRAATVAADDTMVSCVKIADGVAYSTDRYRLSRTPMGGTGQDVVFLRPTTALKRFLAKRKGAVHIGMGDDGKGRWTMIYHDGDILLQRIPDGDYPPTGQVEGQATTRVATMRAADLLPALKWAVAVHGKDNDNYPVTLCPAGRTMMVYASSYYGDILVRVPLRGIEKPAGRIAVNAQALAMLVTEDCNGEVAIGWDSAATPLTVGANMIMPLNI